MRIIKRTFANLPSSILLLGRAGENNVTKLELDVSKEQSEFKDASFDLVLKTPASEDPYPVVVEVTNNKLTYNFSGSDLSISGYGQLEALVVGSEGELLKSATAKIKINPSIIQNTYPGPLQKVIEDLKEEIGEINGIKVVDTLPLNPETDDVVYVENDEIYWFNGQAWVKITGNGYSPTPEEVAAWNNAAEKAHYHENKQAIDRITGDENNAFYNGNKIPLIAPDDVILLEFKTYENLIVRDDVLEDGIQNVPVYVGSAALICSLSNGTDSISLAEFYEPSTGMPIRAIRVMLDGTTYTYYGRSFLSGETTIPAGWVNGNEPDLTNFSPSSYKYEGTTYNSLENLPDDAKSALRSLSQCINVSAAAMGTITVPEESIVRFSGTIKPNQKYMFKTSSDCTFTLPTVPWTREDVQFVLYLTCVFDVDLTFPNGTLIVGGSINSETGAHKLIGCYLKNDSIWSVGGIDYEAVT